MPTLSIVVPVYNEERQLRSVIRTLMESACPIDREWIFIDDSSTDRSKEILQELSKEYGFTLLEQNPNQGKGAAVRRGIDHATGDYLMIQDADYEYDPNDVPALLEPLLTGKADVVYGSRFKKNVWQVHRTYHYFVNRLLTLLSNLFSGIYLTDMETCYKIFKTELIQSMNLQSERFGIEVELTAYIAKSHVRISELPISYYPRTRLQGKKINWKDGVAALFHLVRFNLLTSPEQAFKNSQYLLRRGQDKNSPDSGSSPSFLPKKGSGEGSTPARGNSDREQSAEQDSLGKQHSSKNHLASAAGSPHSQLTPRLGSEEKRGGQKKEGASSHSLPEPLPFSFNPSEQKSFEND